MGAAEATRFPGAAAGSRIGSESTNLRNKTGRGRGALRPRLETGEHVNGTTHIEGIEEPRVLSSGEAERAASRAEAGAVDLGRHASALFGWAFENRFTDPDPATPGAVAYALETHARALRQLDAGWMGESVHSLTNRERGERAGVAFLASRYAAEEGEPLTNVADLLHLADRLAQPEGGPLGDAALKRRHDAESGRDLTLGEFTAARALERYREELAGM